MRHRVTALAGLAAIVLAGCGTSEPPTSSPLGDPTLQPAVAIRATSTTFNDTDVMFLQMMVAHHGQGVTIARLATDRATRPEVKVLAGAIEATQEHEIRSMAGWLRAWGRLPRADPKAHAAHGGMPGTSAHEIAVLEKAEGRDFDRQFLNMMLAHQDDAVQLTRLEARGVNPQARHLARQIARSRSAQITQMLRFLVDRTF